MIDLFSDCFYQGPFPESSQCAFAPNVRFHYIDYRQLGGSLSPASILTDILGIVSTLLPRDIPLIRGVANVFSRYDIFELQELTYQILLQNDTVKEMFDIYWDPLMSDLIMAVMPFAESEDLTERYLAQRMLMNFEKIALFAKRLPIQHSRIHKQFSKLDPDLKKRLLGYFEDMNGPLPFQFKRPTPAMRHTLKNISKDVKPEEWNAILSLLIKNDSMIMDAYGIARALRMDSPLHVAYMGANHVIRWGEVFRYLGVAKGDMLVKKADKGAGGLRDKMIQLTPAMHDILVKFL